MIVSGTQRFLKSFFWFETKYKKTQIFLNVFNNLKLYSIVKTYTTFSPSQWKKMYKYRSKIDIKIYLKLNQSKP